MNTATAAPPSPFRGLTPFGDSEVDALLFFGREREREIVVANLMASRLTVLYGPSGVGKTSLLRAGVAHALREAPDAAVVVVSSWGGDPTESVRSAIGKAVGFSLREETLRESLERASDAIEGDVYLMLDQFEEYFLYHEHDEGFAAGLADAVRQSGLRANVLIGIREDALAKLDVFKRRIPGLFANSLRLDRLDRAAGETAILGPVNAYNGLVSPDERVDVEPALVAAVLDEVAAGRVDLGRLGRGSVSGPDAAGRIEAPYLQLVLERLWEIETAEDSHRLRLETLNRLGGATRIVEGHLDHAMAALTPREQDAAAAMYNQLVTPSGTKIAHGIGDLAGYAAIGEAEAAAVLRRLSDDRIVRAGENGGAGRYEIFHDVLADAVLAWRTRHDADRRLAEQRVASDRRHRRMVFFVAGALGALFIVAALAVYALVQRSDARHQAALADAGRHVALQKKHEADVAEQRARRSAAVARQQKRKAVTAKQEARAQAEHATAAQANAEQQKTIAEQQTAVANKEKSAADVANQHAQTSAVAANHAAARANAATADALRRKRVALARQILATAESLLDTNSEASVRNAIRAVTAFRAARLRSSPKLETTLRSGLLGLKVKAILPGGGAVRTARISPDESLVLVAGQGGTRLFDLDHGFRLRRLLPAVPVSAGVFSADSKLVAAAGSKDDAVHVWDAQSGTALFALPHPAAVVSIAFSPDGRFLATGCADGKARLWRLPGGLLDASFTHDRGMRGIAVQAVSFSPDGKRLLTVGGDRFARVYDVDTHERVLLINNIALINTDHFSHDGKLIATAGSDSIVRIWNAKTGGGPIAELGQSGEGPINDVEFSPDDTWLATAEGAATIARVWSLKDRSAMSIFTQHLSGVASVAWTPDGRSVVSTARDAKAYLWSANGGFVQAAFLGHTAPVNGASFSTDGRWLVTASDDGTARLWSSARLPPAREIANQRAAVNAVAFSHDGRRAISAGADGTARILGPGSRVLTLKHDKAVTAASFSTDDKTVLTGSADGTARLWRASDGTLIATMRHGASVTMAELSPSGRVAVTAGSDGSAELWDARRGALLHRLSHRGPVNDARFSPSGKLVVTASDDGTAAIWRVADGKRLQTLTGHTAPVVAAVFSPYGKRIATASADDTARIFDVATGRTEQVLKGHTSDLTAVAFSPDGSRLATSSLDDDARVWDVRTGNQVALLRIHQGLVSDVAFSADGRWLATAGPGAAGIWRAPKTGEWPALPLYLVRGQTKAINDLAFSPRGWRLLTGGRDGSVRMFDCTACTGLHGLVKLARARLNEIVRVKR
ncbi:MAG: hypothetical protein E6G50_12290 [Actinobacteria bacterium]|nr:MAG: hypothetical protein E6G50_12290 [Actinomycetota bacterium]